ncbi:MAG: CAP-associated domain-containing protein [Liquorilactobacillus nagelii]|jgi:hypothetical protein|uniref:CAP-associated domain-containing protein n=1 Tax=Liquorilactobacillus nagelii TaxID=82688 RepID=UPI00242AB42D|nr:CAP-associated domain-containing protein [Liquorilactobacillus nagelii]MCI1634500.1 CAP-associated domain-containing protein [Liquorilactobacillus nagelii]MCI1920415.1 CAP-associated domain-containing protein [Liquorilactobacillus nagelii]MCI1976059.1 CAP-associated domain-containing protein [Liquorilactobacillus nagelii]
MKKKFYWKSLLNFLWVLIFILGFFYFSTALRDQHLTNSARFTKSKQQNDNNIKLTTPKVKALKTSKTASYIGKSSTEVLLDFGQPSATVGGASNIDWWLYNLNSQNYLKFGIDQYTKKVAAIFVIGSSPIQGKLKVGLTFKKLLRLTTLYANFKFNYREQAFQYELSETDLNQHPLISFKNGSYAVAYLKPKTKEVYALEYLNTDTLLKKNLYHLVAPVPLPAQYQGEVDWSQLQQMVPEDLLQLINAKRLQQNRTIISFDQNLTETASAVANKLAHNPQKWLKAKQARQLKNILSDNFNQRTGIFLRQSNLTKKQRKSLGVSQNDIRLWVIAPIYSSSKFFDQDNLLQNWINTFVESSHYRLGISYGHGVMVIISSKGEN